MSTAAALTDAVLAALRADPDLVAGLSGRIWETAPRDPAFPHLVLDEVICRDRSGLDADLEEARFALRIFARDGGRAQAAAIGERVEAILLAAALAPVGTRLVLLRRDASENRLARDRRTAEAAVRFVALIEPV